MSQYQEQVSTAILVGNSGRAAFNLLNPVWVKLKDVAINANMDSTNTGERTLRLRVLDSAGVMLYDIFAFQGPGSSAGPWQQLIFPVLPAEVLIPPLGAVVVDELNTIVAADQMTLAVVLEY
jgi:hypothetical protein